MKTFYYFYIVILFFLGTNSMAQIKWHVMGDPVVLTPEGNYFQQPVCSPDGKKIAITGRNYAGIWVMDANGDNLQQITQDPGAGYQMLWSGNSKEIIGRAIKYEGHRRIFQIKAYNIAQKRARVLTTIRSSLFTVPKLTPDRNLIYFRTRQGLQIINYAIPKSTTTSLFSGQIVFPTAQGINIANRDGKVLRSLKPVPGTYLNLTVSPDGQQVAFEVLGGHMFVVNLTEGTWQDLGAGERPHWSPDSQWLVYMITHDDGHQILNSDIYIIKIDGSGKKPLTVSDEGIEMDPDFSPDGKYIVYGERKSGRIFRLNLVQK